ncbi:hypothetical protein GHK46_13670 [Sinorhizobium medicae]|uniref:hypothetical protein n=1 Tax=Sinorhizobium medicae TaxID=110321 RepID=UPI00129547BE|nr:hypothetical protein [Sinorhizobium medicae]MQV98352.1 hypothetical protein [Sinorhizobium medicae]
MTLPLPGLVVDIEGRVDKLEKAMAKANGIQRRGSSAMEARARQSARSMESTYAKAADNIGSKLQTMFEPLMRGGAVIAGVGGAAIALKEIANSVAEVEREARKAGVSSKVWQQWTYVATATGMSIDGVTDALKELNIRGDEFARTGKGSGQEWFTTLGYSAEEVGRKLKEPNAFLDELIGKIQKLDQAGQTRALDELFGGTGAEELAKVLGLSVAEIQKMRDEAANFTSEQIEAAKKIDREFSTMWRNFTVYAKSAAIEGVNVASEIIGVIRDLSDPGGDVRDAAIARYNSLEEQLKRLERQRQGILDQIDAAKASPFNVMQEAEIRQLEAALKAVDEQILEVTGGSADFKSALKELSSASNSLSSSFNGNVASASNFKAALAELKNLVPELKAELDALAQSNALDTAYQKAVRNARTMGEVMQATDLARRARSIATYGNHTNMLDLIGAAEGTDKGRGYNETLGYGAFTGGAVNLTGMTINDVLALQKRMLAHPDNSYNSSAVGRYQITKRTLESLMGELGLTGDRLFNVDTQDELARALLRRRGDDLSGLRNEWEGLRGVDDATIRSAYGGTPTAAQKLEPTEGQQQAIELDRQRADARRNLNQTVQEGLDLARFEQSISGMSAQQQRVELQLYQMQAEAKRQGITLTAEEIAKMREKLELTEGLKGKTEEAADSAEGLKNAQMFFAESFTSSLSGLLTGTTSLNDAVRGLINSLIDAALQAALLGKGPLGGLFGGGTGIFGSLFGWADGGYTGNGGKYEPAGVVHRGEYVMSKKATSRIGVGNLEALHRGALGGFAEGGFVGSAPALRTPNLKAANSSAPPVQQITISAPVTVNTNGGGTPEQNADLATRMAKQMEATMRGVVAEEMRKQTRPGNMMNNRSR